MMQFLANRRTAFREHIATLAMTNLRIYCTLMMTTLTGVVYLGVAVARLALAAAGKPVAGVVWEPSWEWLGFLAAIGGIDAAQFAAKRITQSEYVEAKGRVSGPTAKVENGAPPDGASP
ncbi:MAG: hypothetical protein A3J75_06340 [Acidobacteria bacterium RBG_16_68_9]|nr:MAG: hypothetical protein A3J75_06340 [Acidobacteria bacterium RBG_16_68_9]